MDDNLKQFLSEEPVLCAPPELSFDPDAQEPITAHDLFGGPEHETSNDGADEPEPGAPQIIARHIKQDPNHFESKAGKALRDGKEMAFIQKVVRKWEKVYQNYQEMTDFLADYFNLTESISWNELNLLGLTIQQINTVERTLQRKGNLFLDTLVPFDGWAYKWYDQALYDHFILKKELTEDDIRRLAYRNGDDYEELKKLEARGGYGEGKMWPSIKSQVLELAAYNVKYTFWDD